jgi:hypothetical protein
VAAGGAEQALEQLYVLAQMARAQEHLAHVLPRRLAA